MGLIVILTLGFILRLINLNQSLWLDEAVQAITVKGSIFEISTELRGDFHPPLYHLFLWGWVHLFGNSEIVLRMPSVIFGVATVFVVYLLAKDIFPKKNFSFLIFHFSFPEIVGLFLATAPFLIYYSQEARMYAMGTFLAALSMYWFIKISNINYQISKIDLKFQIFNTGFLSYLIFTVFLLYCDYYGFLILLSQGIYWLVRKRYKFLLMTGFFLLIAYLPWIPMLVKQLQVGLTSTESLPGWGQLVNLSFIKALPLTFIKFSLGRITIFNKPLYAAVFAILFVIYGAVVLKGFLRGKKLLITNHQLIITFWLFVPILFAWLISFFIPNYQPFRLLLALPAFYLLLTFGISRTSTSIIYIIEVLFILLVNLISVGIYYKNPYFWREDWRGTVSFIEEKDNAIAVLPSATSNWPWQYYSSGKVRLIGISPGARMVDSKDFDNLTLRQALDKQFINVYYIRYLQPLFDPEEKIIFWLTKNGYNKTREISFNQLLIYEYKLAN